MEDLSDRLKLIVIVGPTASGKSDLAIRLAKKYSGEIISADSRQVYYGMNLGTGKVPKDSFRNFQSNPKSKILNKDFYSRGVKHHLIDVASPKKQFTASDFKELGEKAIKDIVARGKIPIIVGGTGFYIDILLGRMTVAQVPPNPKLRKHFDKLSAEHLFKMLRKLDPHRAKTIDRHNKRRLMRALEIVITTGKPVPKLNLSTPYQVLWLGLKPKNLDLKIEKRLNMRLKHGLAREVKRLHEKGLSWKRLENFGLEYRWLSLYLQKKVTYIEMKEKLLRDIVRYSKRQMTWFKGNKEIYWIKDGKIAQVLFQRFIG